MDRPASHRTQTALLCVAAGLAIAAALPPWGWWPLAFVGFAVVDHLLANSTAAQRFRRVTLVTVSWLTPGMLWMFDLTPPGYVIAVLLFSAMFGAAAAASPASRWRRLAFPASTAIAAAAMWRWPFGGVPLATLPMTQAQSPLLPVARVGGSLLLGITVVVVGMTLAAALERHWRSAGFGIAFLAAALGLSVVAPDGGEPVDAIDVAIVQGGGQQRTRATPEGAQVVFDRHVEASADVQPGVDLVLWPENVVNPVGPMPDEPLDRLLYTEEAEAGLAAVAAQTGAPVVPGWFYSVSPTETVNYTDVWLPDGETGDRYDKVQIVPFGEFVPLRPLLELFAKDVLPPRDVRRGVDPAVLDTPAGTFGISISWEIFFERRGRDGIHHGGQALINPTNGSSYWLTILQTQQLASSRLRAVETGRWVLQAAPTGFSAIISPDGDVLERTDISEQAVLHGTIELREGLTWGTRLGPGPVVALALALVVAAAVLDRSRSSASELDQPSQLYQ